MENNPDFNRHYLQRFSVKPLAPLEGYVKHGTQNGVLLSHNDYLTFVDTSARIQRRDKRGFIPDTCLPILHRLDIDADKWIENT